ncbi:phage tail length tape measure family protein [Bradyrhizobium sp. 45]|uniref:phage tail length tape measure family protein n=1 Tax=Bradyrhizobium sp. 45 TaxID=1043587 RepID=UPI001FF70F81|nr:phage tail length tape measure family protein [Bradyrhizobium sp. 45]MCK1304624.1 phage tail tape measure protein [Bradyrhizobium sp. 45]
MDLAQIGFAADTSDLDQAKTSLNALVPAARAAEQAADRVSASMGGVNKASGATTKVMMAASGATGATAAANKVAAAAANDNVNATNKARQAAKGMSADAKNLSYQLVDVAQGLASGQPVFQIFAQQAGQIGQVIATAKGGLAGLFKELAGSIGGFFTATRTAALGGVALVGTLGAIASAAIKSALALDDVRTATDLTLKQASGLQSATTIKGISKEDFAAGIAGFAQSVSEAQHNMGSLNGLMIASGKSAKDLTGYLANVADIVAQTASNVQKRNILEAAGLPTTAQWVRFMSQGGQAVRDAAAGMDNFNEQANEKLIASARKFDEMWNGAITNFKNNFVNAIVGMTAAMETFYDKVANKAAGFGNSSFWKMFLPSNHAEIAKAMGIEQISDSFKERFGSFQQPANAAQLATGLQKRSGAANGDQQTQAQLLAANQLSQQRISILGDMATVEQQAKQKQLELTAAGLQGVGVSRDMAAAILNNTRAMAEMSRVQQQATAGVYDANAARKAAADTLQSWIDKGLIDKNNVEQMAAGQQALANQLKQTSDAAAIAGAKFQSLKQIELDGSNFAKLLDTSVSGALNSLVSPIQDVMNGVTSLSAGFKNAGVVILKAIQEMIIKMLVLAPIAQGLQTIFGGFGGGIGSLFGLPSLTKNAAGGVYNSPSLSAYSGQIISQPTMFRFATGAGLMGEAGPEGILPLKRGPSGALGVQMYGGQQAGNDNSMQITYAPTYGDIAPGADPQAIAELRRAQARDRAEFAANVGKTLQNLRKRNVRV